MPILSVIASRLRDSDQMASDLAFLDVSGRLARRLLDLSATNGVQQEDGILLQVTAREELANTDRRHARSVNRNLSMFRRLGLIGREGRKITSATRRGCALYCE